jgi:Lrp/AsnC family transcriptional regulator of ectoine degradation
MAFSDGSNEAAKVAARSRIAGAAARSNLVDRIDLQILSILEREGRISKSTLASLVNLSPSACTERMRLLEKNKLILSYNASVNVRLLAPIEIFFTEVTLKTHRYYDFVKFEGYVAAQSAIVECFALGGGVDYILKIIAQNVDAYQQIIDTMLEAEIGIDRYFTYICTKQVKNASRVPIDAVLESDAAAATVLAAP